MSWAAASSARSPPPLYNPVSLNIGLNCEWQQSCIAAQMKAMNRALKYVSKKHPPAWQIQLCNRNASLKRFRVDWIGFDNCIHNAGLRPLPPRAAKKRAKRLARNGRARGSESYSIGERGRR